MDEEIEYLQIDHISEAEWLDIKRLAIELYRCGAHNGDQGRCYVEAFLQWASWDEGELEQKTFH